MWKKSWYSNTIVFTETETIEHFVTQYTLSYDFLVYLEETKLGFRH